MQSQGPIDVNLQKPAIIPLTKRLPTAMWCFRGPASIQAHVACSNVIICDMLADKYSRLLFNTFQSVSLLVTDVRDKEWALGARVVLQRPA